MLIHHLIWIQTGSGGYGDHRIKMKQTNISVDATENNKANYNCSKNSKHLHILPGMKTINS